jgi:hypothetical protein
MLCTVCTVHKETRSTCFLVEPQNQGCRVSQFGDLGLKITMTVSWFGHQNQASDGLSVAPQNQREEDSVRHTSRSSGLLHLEVSRARVFQFASKLAMERWWVVHVASSWRSMRRAASDSFTPTLPFL